MPLSTLCMLRNFSCFLLSSADLKKNISGTRSKCQTFWLKIRSWFGSKLFAKTKVATSKEILVISVIFGTGIPGLNQCKVEDKVSCSSTSGEARTCNPSMSSQVKPPRSSHPIGICISNWIGWRVSVQLFVA